MDPRLNTLKTHALMWDRSVDWLEEPDQISLEIIPPTHWPESCELAGAGTASSATLGLAYPRRDPATECRALAILAQALIHAVHGR
jgi:hypothetical protein